MKLHLTAFFLPLCVALASGAAQGQTHSAYVGGAFIDIHSSAPPLAGGPALPPPGALLEVDDARTLLFGYEYRMAGPWGVEAAVGLPPRHKTYGRGVLEPFGQVSSVKQVSPTVFLNYHFSAMAGGIEPFVGAGLNFTRFTGARSTVAGNLASGGPTRIELKDSWGLAAHVGASVPVAPRWHLIGFMAAAQVKSDLTATTSTAGGDVVRTTRINFRPVVYSMVLSYTF